VDEDQRRTVPGDLVGDGRTIWRGRGRHGGHEDSILAELHRGRFDQDGRLVDRNLGSAGWAFVAYLALFTQPLDKSTLGGDNMVVGQAPTGVSSREGVEDVQEGDRLPGFPE
jgi:hypothetical protein